MTDAAATKWHVNYSNYGLAKSAVKHAHCDGKLTAETAGVCGRQWQADWVPLSCVIYYRLEQD